MPDHDRNPKGSQGPQPRRGDEQRVVNPERASLEQAQREGAKGQDEAPSHPKRSEKSPWLGGG